MRSWMAIGIVAISAWAFARADETSAPPVPVASETIDDISELRDPFWPVGYTPRAAVAPAPAGGDSDEEERASVQIQNLSPEQQAALARKIQISAIMKTGSNYFARLNNQLVGAGDEVVVNFEGRPLTLVVLAIGKNSVQIEPKP